MNQYIYDGTFEGLLTTLFYTYTCKEDIQITRASLATPHLFLEPITISTEEDKYNRVYNSILTKLSSNTLRNIYYLYLSELEDADMTIYHYIKLCYRYSDDINLAKNNDVIIKVDTYCRKVSLEAHRFKGFVRFQEVAPGIFYSKIEPDHYILPLILDHFTNRFSDQYFVIQDLKRELAIVYNKRECFIKDLTRADGKKLEQAAHEDQFEQLFKSFYSSINIPERKNLRQQSAYMPKRYWKHLIEL